MREERERRLLFQTFLGPAGCTDVTDNNGVCSNVVRTCLFDVYQLSDGQYQRLCKTAESLDNEKRRQTERMSELAAIVDRLTTEYPTAGPSLRKAVLAYGSRIQPPSDETDD